MAFSDLRVLPRRPSRPARRRHKTVHWVNKSIDYTIKFPCLYLFIYLFLIICNPMAKKEIIISDPSLKTSCIRAF